MYEHFYSYFQNPKENSARYSKLIKLGLFTVENLLRYSKLIKLRLLIVENLLEVEEYKIQLTDQTGTTFIGDSYGNGRICYSKLIRLGLLLVETFLEVIVQGYKT